MPVPTSISQLSTTPGSNSPSGSDAPSVLDDHQRTAYAFIRTLSDTKLDASKAASTTDSGAVELATDAEAKAGTDTSRAITAANLRAGLNAAGTAPVYASRAWAKWSGTITGTNAPTAGGNVSTVERVSTGVYIVTFTTAMPSADYAISASAFNNISSTTITNVGGSSPSSTSFTVTCVNGAGTAIEPAIVTASVFC